ncbi:UNVERIFIED_CONTAM: Nudix hydrolase 26, chloroplastic, partial [Sesamum latifolium]
RINTASLLFPNCPSRLQKFTALSLPAPFSSLSSSSMDSPPEGYRRNVGICLINPSKKIFAASRLDIPDAWQMPQGHILPMLFDILLNNVGVEASYDYVGGIDESEDPRNAAIRELREETGVTSADIVAEAPYWLTYDFPPDVREKLKRQWGSDWKGQAQKWFLLKFTGKDEEVNLLGDGTEKAEFGQWSWMSPQEIVDHVSFFLILQNCEYFSILLHLKSTLHQSFSLQAVDFKKPVYQEVLKKGPDPIDVDASSVDDIFCKQRTRLVFDSVSNSNEAPEILGGKMKLVLHEMAMALLAGGSGKWAFVGWLRGGEVATCCMRAANRAVLASLIDLSSLTRT